MKINILLCDTFPGLLPESIPSYESMFMNLFDSVEKEPEYEVFNVFDGNLPHNMMTKELYVITGCNLSVYDNVAWIKSLLEWIRRASTHHIHMLGICFGHQALAYALGGEVRRAASGWGVGKRESRFTSDVFQDCFPDGTMQILYNHHDQVTALPCMATRLAESAFCPNEAFLVGDYAVGIQGHPEYTTEYVTHLLLHHSQQEDKETVRRALSSLKDANHDGRLLCKAVLHLFPSLSV